MRKRSRKSQKRLADKLFSQWIRSEGYCEWCGVQRPPERLHAAHIFTRRYLVTRWHQDNCLALCPKCHFKAHEQPLEFAEFVKKLYGTRKYNALRRKAKTSIKKIDLDEIITKYQELLKGGML